MGNHQKHILLIAATPAIRHLVVPSVYLDSVIFADQVRLHVAIPQDPIVTLLLVHVPSAESVIPNGLMLNCLSAPMVIMRIVAMVVGDM